MKKVHVANKCPLLTSMTYYKVSDSVYDIVAKPSFTRLTKNEIRKEFKPCAITYFFNQPLSKIRLNMFT